MAKVKQKSKSYALRIEAHLVEPLQKLKKRNRRSLNAEINAALEQWVAGTPKATRAKAAKAAAAPAIETSPAEPPHDVPSPVAPDPSSSQNG